MKITIEGTPEEIKDVLKNLGGKVINTSPKAKKIDINGVTTKDNKTNKQSIDNKVWRELYFNLLLYLHNTAVKPNVIPNTWDDIRRKEFFDFHCMGTSKPCAY